MAIDLSPGIIQLVPNALGQLIPPLQAPNALSGGTAALAWEALDGDLIHKSRLRLTTDGTNAFGTKAQSAPVLVDHGTEVYENGVLNAYRQSVTDGTLLPGHSTQPSEIYTTNSNLKLVTTSRPQRHANSGGHYIGIQLNNDPNRKALGGGFVNGPIAAGGSEGAAFHNYHYQAWWVKYRYHFGEMHRFDFTNKVGTFTLPDLVADPDALGERVTTFDGRETYIMREVDGSVCLYTPGTPTAYHELGGTTITGQTSGASMDITYIESIYTAGVNSSDRTGGAEKLTRIWNDGGTDFRYTWNQTLQEAFGAGSDNYPGRINDAGRAEPGQWALLEAVIDWPAKLILIVANGTVLSTYDITSATYSDQTKGFYIAEIGWQPIDAMYQVIEFGEIYLDHAFQRVFIGDAPTWGACTKRELQIPTAWADGQADIQLNLGDLGTLGNGDRYIYVVTGRYPADNDSGVAI